MRAFRPPGRLLRSPCTPRPHTPRAASSSAWRVPLTPGRVFGASTGPVARHVGPQGWQASSVGAGPHAVSLDLPPAAEAAAALRGRILEDLAAQDYAVVDGLMGSERCCLLWRELNAIYEGGYMRRSRSTISVGGQAFEFDKPNVVAISDFSPLDPAHCEAPERLADHRQQAGLVRSPVPLTREFEAFLGGFLLQCFNGHAVEGGAPLALVGAHAKVAASLGPAGGARTAAHYVPHFDNVALGTDRRRISAVYYLNPFWAPGHGGLLRCYPLLRRGQAAPHCVEVEPLLDRLVLFRADVMLHAVTPYTPPLGGQVSVGLGLGLGG